jgi:tetraacyldisaccharide 4'-kinase
MNDTSARRLLFPLNPLYRLALAFRELSLMWPTNRLRSPVISIGNLSTGGSGKTPLTIALAWALERRGIKVDILSRGYGREGNQALRVDEDGSAEEFGDEPLLMALAAEVPVYVAPQRYDAGLLAEAEYEAEQAADRAKEEEQALADAKAPDPYPNKEQPGKPEMPENAMVLVKPELEIGPMPEESAQAAEPVEPETSVPPLVHLLDDGFQHRQLERDVDILLLNSRDWKDWLLPAGNLREPLEAARRASVIAIPANEPELEVALQVWGWTGPVWQLHRVMEIPAVNGPVAAFCGIARPEQFFAGLEAAGLEIATRFAFPDHYPYTRHALDELLANAQAAGAKTLITTEKDLVRLGGLTALIPQSMPLATARLRIKIENQAAAINWLIAQITPSSNPIHL